MGLKIDDCSSSLNKAGEEINGNIIEILRDGQNITALFADGEGDGTGASITAAFVIRMAKFLLHSGSSAQETVQTIAETYADPIGEGHMPGLAVVGITAAGLVSVASLNMPEPVVLRRGRLLRTQGSLMVAGGKRIYFSAFTAKSGTMLLLFNEGLLLAGQSGSIGWTRAEVEDFLQAAYRPAQYTAGTMTRLLLTAARSLEQDRPAHDISVLALQASENSGGAVRGLQNPDASDL